MKKKELVEAFKSRVKETDCVTKSDFEWEIAALADEDEAFEDIVFDFGCSVLAKKLAKEKKKRKE